MSTAPINKMAPELISQIFCSLEDFLSATNLSQTSHRFQAVWQQDINRISYAIHQHSIECTHQVYEYLSASVEAGKTLLQGDKREIAIAKTLVILDRADKADNALSMFVKIDADITATTRRDFIQAYHRAWTLAILAPQPPPYQMIIKMDVLELLQLEEVFMWMTKYINALDEAGVGYGYSVREIFSPPGYSETNVHTWECTQKSVRNIIENIKHLVDVEILQTWSKKKRSDPQNLHALMCGTWHSKCSYYPKLKQFMLADVVHLLPETSDAEERSAILSKYPTMPKENQRHSETKGRP